MTPGARLQAAVDCLAQMAATKSPADDVVAGYFRGHRFAGVKDRAAISEHIYTVLRGRAGFDWWIARLSDLAPTPRLRLFAALVLRQGWTEAEIHRACDGDRYRPNLLADAEAAFVRALMGHTPEHPEMPDWVRLNYPEWLDPMLREIFGAGLAKEMAALNAPAALDMRANALKASPEEVRASLATEGVFAQPTPLSPLGLRVWNRIPLSSLETFKSGAVEVQDEGSQVAAILADARPGMRVVDFCAGAGGKTLALAASMGNRGHLVACDTSEHRLERAVLRLRRAGAGIVERRVLVGERDRWVKRHAGGFDRVFVDAPCTGTGTWRRNPDAKWRLAPGDLDELAALQGRILDSAARLVRPGGRLIYATCSLLPRENDRQIEAFVARHAEFGVLPVGPVWGSHIAASCPDAGPFLHLTPARHGTDGFFVAILERAAGPAPASDSLAD